MFGVSVYVIVSYLILLLIFLCIVTLFRIQHAHRKAVTECVFLTFITEHGTEVEGLCDKDGEFFAIPPHKGPLSFLWQTKTRNGKLLTPRYGIRKDKMILRRWPKGWPRFLQVLCQGAYFRAADSEPQVLHAVREATIAAVPEGQEHVDMKDYVQHDWYARSDVVSPTLVAMKVSEGVARATAGIIRDEEDSKKRVQQGAMPLLAWILMGIILIVAGVGTYFAQQVHSALGV